MSDRKVEERGAAAEQQRGKNAGLPLISHERLGVKPDVQAILQSLQRKAIENAEAAEAEHIRMVIHIVKKNFFGSS